MFELMAMTFVLMFSELAIAKREMEFEHMRNEMRQKLEELDKKKGYTETADLKVYRDAENKDKNMADVTYILKRNAVDCNLNLYSNQFTDTYF